MNQQNMLVDIENTKKMCKLLMESPHYQKMGAQGIFAVVEKAKSIGVNPIDALNGGMYYAQGRVELSAGMMNQLIRSHGHSVTKDKKSDATICILHGRRKDNGDTWVESFSIEDAKLAGIYRNQWLKYPKDMLFARALSRLARQLFPDVIKGCYVEGEISMASGEDKQVSFEAEYEITNDEYNELMKLLSCNDSLRENISNYLKNRFNITDLREMPRDVYELALKRAEQKNVDHQQYGEQQQMEA